MIYVVYPSGAHGSFLVTLLNYMTGSDVYTDRTRVTWDSAAHNSPGLFKRAHHLMDAYKQTVTITVTPESYLKYASVCLSRTSGNNIWLEELNTNTFVKLQNHSIFKYFIPSLEVISGQSSGGVSNAALREWARLCLFANNGHTITQWIQYKPGSDYQIDFEDFYKGNIYDCCIGILDRFNIPVVRHNINDLVSEFFAGLRYNSIGADIPVIIDNIVLGNNVEIPKLLWIEQAWLDNWLVDNFNINPVDTDDYFATTQQLFDRYQLKSG